MTQRIEVLMDKRELVAVMRPGEIGDYLMARRIKLAGPRIVDLAHRLEINTSQASDLIHSRIPFGTKMIERLNAIDPEFELVQVVGVVRKQHRPPSQLT